MIPIGLITIVNCVLFGLVLKEIRSKKKSKKVKNEDFEMIRVISICFFTTGLAWLFGFIMIIPLPSSLDYLGFIFSFLFCIFNAFQGVFIFISSILMKTFLNSHAKFLKNRKKNLTFKQTISCDSTNKTSHFELTAMSSVQTTLSNVEYIYVDNVIQDEEKKN